MKGTTVVVLVLGLFFLAGCGSAPAATPPDPVSAPQPVSQPAGAQPGTPAAPVVLRPAQTDPPAAKLLPGDGAQHGFTLSDGTTVEEHYIRDGSRLIGSYNGQPYVTWFITDQGIWRQDPRGPGLLRYLPPEPADGLAWKQRSGDTDVWFSLRAVPECQTPFGQTNDVCWQLTVLNRQEQTIFRFAPGPTPPPYIDDLSGVMEVRTDNYASPAESYVKTRRQSQAAPPPSREALLKGAVPWPTQVPAPIESVTAAEFVSAQRRLAAEAGQPVQEVDLNGDGKTEAIVGKLGQWHTWPVQILDSQGNRLLTLNESLPPSIQGRVDLVTIAGVPNPVLVRQAGTPNEWHDLEFEWLEGDQLVSAGGWHPKTNLALGMDYAIRPDGTVEIVGSLGGYSFVNHYQIEKEDVSPIQPYVANQLSEQVTPGPYPTTAADLMTDLFIARWYGVTTEMERYIPDPAVRAAFMAQDVGQVLYLPYPVQVGKLSFEAPAQLDWQIPKINPAPPGPDGATEFLATVGEYEGVSYWTGRVLIGPAADGRLVVRSLEFGKSGWYY